jgi:hypothetical protein
MSIPQLQENNELPPGEHPASLQEIEKIYGLTSDRRKKLMNLLYMASENLKTSGVRTIWINGSFVTNKSEPNDIDGCWEYNENVNLDILDPVFLSERTEMKKKYGLDFFIANCIEASSGLPFPKFFQKNREGEGKGILVVTLMEEEK